MPEPVLEGRVPHYFDTVTLSNFASCGEIGLLVSRYGASLCLTEQVRVELTEGVSGGYVKLGAIERALAEGRILVVTTMSLKEALFFGELIPVLGSGEALCITLAKHRGGVVVTDDLLARRTCSLHGVQASGTIGILKAMCIDTDISADAADALLANMVMAGFHSPVRRISDLL